MLTSRNIGREIGTALAVLAIYLLTMLMPLHQARASQLAFEELGYSTTTVGWVLCTPGLPSGGDSDVTVAKCPATGIGKHELALPTPESLPLAFDRVALSAAPTPVISAFLPAPTAPPTGSRAPPASV